MALHICVTTFTSGSDFIYYRAIFCHFAMFKIKWAFPALHGKLAADENILIFFFLISAFLVDVLHQCTDLVNPFQQTYMELLK